jgi:hypothetical protein
VLRGTQVAPGAEGMQAQGECQMWLWPPLAGAGVPGAGVPGAGVPGAGGAGAGAAGCRRPGGGGRPACIRCIFAGKLMLHFGVRRSILLVEIG